MKYTLAASVRNKEGFSIKNVRALDASEFTKIDDSTNRALSFVHSQSLFNICKRNYEDLVHYWNHVKEEQVRTGKWNSDSAILELVLEINRRLINYLSSFRSFLDHLELKFKRIESETNYFSIFEEKTAYYYDNVFSYRFLYKLRNYVQHCGLPFGGCEFQGSIDSGDGTDSYKFSIYLRRDSLLSDKSFRWAKDLEEEIKEQPERIGIVFHTNTLYDCIEDINKISVQLDLEEVETYWHLLYQRYVEVKKTFPDSYPVVLITEDEAFSSGSCRENVKILEFPLQAMQLIQNLKEEIKG